VSFAGAQPNASWKPSPRYTFDAFVVGPSNQLACAAAQAVAARPGEAYNPLFIYGGVGLGKTHLMHAIAHEAISQGRIVTYVSSETFTNELIAGIRERRTEEFRSRYRSADVLLVDDVQFIAGKEATQEEFFHTFNALHTAGRQVVLSSDRPPRAIPTLEDRLRSRFEWGLIADIQAPDLETRTAILQRRVREQGAIVPPEVLTYIAQRIQSNIRELEGSLTRVLAHAELTRRPLNTDLAAIALSDVVSNPVRRYIGSEQVIDAVCRYFKADGRAIRGQGRAREIVVPRQVAMYLLREETGASTLEIGRELGGRDHSTVLHGANKIQREMDADANLRKDVLAIRDLIYAEAHP
jgi:chromosomal replication initiator protein